MQPPWNTRGCVVPTAVHARGPRAPKTEPHGVHPTDEHGTTAMLTNFRASTTSARGCRGRPSLTGKERRLPRAGSLWPHMDASHLSCKGGSTAQLPALLVPQTKSTFSLFLKIHPNETVESKIGGCQGQPRWIRDATQPSKPTERTTPRGNLPHKPKPRT